ncbi:helix-turn-helix transcriptional regulator [Brevibacillus sp. MER 51]|uniref:helix-turn-helix transcriptional regulator n=1 Tax=Brevibacillus sp. MER 51 TaxID=2939560 RepID=UPI00333E58D1
MQKKQSNKIRYFRTKLGLTQQELGQKFNKPKDVTVISRWERGVIHPSTPHLIELCRILKVKSPGDIFFDNN